MTRYEQSRYPRNRWTVGLIILAPRARTLTVSFREQPEDREVEALMAEHGAVIASVRPPEHTIEEAIDALSRAALAPAPPN